MEEIRSGKGRVWNSNREPKKKARVAIARKRRNQDIRIDGVTYLSTTAGQNSQRGGDTGGQLIATKVAEVHPREATTERFVKARGAATVYVDYLQNIQGKTVAGAYCVRAKPGARFQHHSNGPSLRTIWIHAISISEMRRSVLKELAISGTKR